MNDERGVMNAGRMPGAGGRSSFIVHHSSLEANCSQ